MLSKLIEEFGTRGNIYVATEKAHGALLYTLMQYPQLMLFPLNSKRGLGCRNLALPERL